MRVQGLFCQDDGLSEKVMFEQRPEGCSEGRDVWASGGKVFRQREQLVQSY